MNMLSDTKGRRFSFIISLAIANVGIIRNYLFYLVLILGAYAKSVVLMSFSQIVVGFGGYSVMIIGYMILSDLCKDSMRQKAILSMNGVW
jgi:MFS family permease